MKTQVIVSVLILVLVTGQYNQLNGQTNVSGTITTNTSWTLSGSPYILTGTLRVMGGATLTIQSGVQINLGNRYFYVGYYDFLGSSQSGILQATGVTFTGSGGSLQFEYTATGTISNCSFVNTNLRFENSSGPSVTNNTFDLNSPIYLHSQEVIPRMSGNTFGSGKFYISLSFTSNTTISNYPNCTYYLDGALRVMGGATLTIQSGVQINLGNRYFYVGYYDFLGSSQSGILQATGVTFTGSGGSLQFEYTATGTISNCGFVNTNVKFENSSGPSVTNNTFDLNSPIYLHSQEVIPRMSGNTFGSGKFYISLSFTSNTTISNYPNCTYYLDGALRVMGGATLTIQSGVQINLGNRYFYVGYYDFLGSSQSGILQATRVTFTGSTGVLQFEYNATGQVTNCSFSYQLSVKGMNQSTVVISQSNFGVLCSVQNTSSVIMNARNNYWGDASGPYHPSLNPNGRGATVSDRVDFVPFSTTPITTDVKETDTEIPQAFALSQNYPNPFNPSTTISYQLPTQSHVTLKMFDVLGREVASLVSETVPAGTYKKSWNAKGLASGIYFYRLQAGSFVETKKLILMR